MPINSNDCKKAICAIVTGPNGGRMLAEAYNGSPNISAFLSHCWMNDKQGNQIPATSIGVVIQQAGDLKNWKRFEKSKVSYAGEYCASQSAKNTIYLRAFNCVPFEDQIRAYVWDDGNTILKVEIQGE